MDDLISRQVAIDTLTTECSWALYDEYGQLTPNGEEIIGTLKKIPSAQKKGHWFKRCYIGARDVTVQVCSNCRSEWSYDAETGVSDYNFCPNCGADMRGEDNG